MILKSSSSPIIPLPEKEVSSITFKDSSHLRNFIQSIHLFMKKKNKSENEYFYLMDEDYQDIPNKDFHPIMMDCGKLDLSMEKTFKDGTLSYFETMIYENMEINESFHKLQVSIDGLVNQLEITKGGYTLEVQSHTFDVKNIIKLLNIDLHLNGSELNHLGLRECFTDIISSLNYEKKNEVLFILFPETNLGIKDMEKFMKNLAKRKVTTLIVTNSLEIIQNVKFNNVNLVKENKKLYDTVKIANELELFEMKEEINSNMQVVQLSYLDFTGTEILVNKEYREFLD